MTCSGVRSGSGQVALVVCVEAVHGGDRGATSSGLWKGTGKVLSEGLSAVRVAQVVDGGSEGDILRLRLRGFGEPGAAFGPVQLHGHCDACESRTEGLLASVGEGGRCADGCRRFNACHERGQVQ